MEADVAGRLRAALGPLPWLLLLCLLALPAEALACPNCAMRPENPSRSLLILSMILLPWTVFGAAWFFIRRQMRGAPDAHTDGERLGG